MVSGLVSAPQTEHDPPLGGLGHSAGAFAELALDRVGLPEMRPARVENQRLPAAQLVIQQTRQTRVPTLGEPGRHARGIFFLRIEIDVEVLGLQHLEVELLVLNFVATEVAPCANAVEGAAMASIRATINTDERSCIGRSRGG